MSETVIPDLFTEKWLLIVRKAKKFLTRSQYEDWKFMIGSGSSPAERAEIGEAALRQLMMERMNQAAGGYIIPRKNLSNEEFRRIRNAVQDYFSGGGRDERNDGDA